LQRTWIPGELCVPIYEYACKRCEHTLDALQKMGDDPLLDCPECGEPALKRLISAPRFRLKGQGWYETDFKKDNQRNLAKDDTETVKPAAKSGKKETAEKAKVESKPKATAKKESS
jgi:putative FmdB family regulatory protein